VFKERRKMPRRQINRLAQFRSEAGAASGECMVTDISEGGARLFTELDLPEAFTLWLGAEDTKMQRECRVVWRLGGEIGVEFVKAH